MDTATDQVRWHAMLCDLLDEQALALAFDPTSSDGVAIVEIRTLARRLDRPHAGYDGLSGLHSRRAGNHSDPQWVQVHKQAAAFYARSAQSLLDTAGQLAQEICHCDPDTVQTVVARNAIRARALMREHGCQITGTLVMLHLADAATSRGAFTVAEMIAYEVILRDDSTHTGRALASAAQVRLANVAAGRSDMMLAEEHLAEALQLAQAANFPIRWRVATSVVEHAALRLAESALTRGDDDQAAELVVVAVEAHRDQPLH